MIYTSTQKISGILITFYSCIFLIGEFGTVDRLGPQTLILSILNTISAIYLIMKSKINYKSISYKGILNTGSIPIYTLLIFISMVISILFSINKIESIISLSHYFNVFFSLFCLTKLIGLIKNYKKLILCVIIISLFVESLYVFYQIMEYYIVYDMWGKWGRTFEIRGFTANINITAFSIAYKFPFLLYITNRFFFKNKLTLLAFTILFLVIIFDIFHLSSRGAILSIILAILMNIFYFIFSNKRYAIYILIVSFLGFLISYSFLKNSNVANPIERTSTITINTEDGSVDQRIRYYKEVINYVIKNPLKPIGVGNYKLKSVEFEKNQITQYIVPYHTHNDFLELWIENGFLSFLLFLLIFLILIKTSFEKVLIKKVNYFFPILVFIIIYFLDSSLNFPIARPVSFLFFNLITAFIIIDNEEFS